MADFDKSKDIAIWEVTIGLTEKTSLKIGKYNFDNKGEKLGVVRVSKGTDKVSGNETTYHNPLGRFTLEEFGIISQAINEKECM
jgi:hypothetical protein